MATCDEGLGPARPSATDTASIFTFADIPKTVTAHTSQEVTKTSIFIAPSQTTPPHTNAIETHVIKIRPPKNDFSSPAFQGHSRSLKPTRIDVPS